MSFDVAKVMSINRHKKRAASDSIIVKGTIITEDIDNEKEFRRK